MKMAVFWKVAPCSLVDTDRRFGRACRIYRHKYYNFNSSLHKSDITVIIIIIVVVVVGTEFCSDFARSYLPGHCVFFGGRGGAACQ
jgi:hypothetical protein